MIHVLHKFLVTIVALWFCLAAQAQAQVPAPASTGVAETGATQASQTSASQTSASQTNASQVEALKEAALTLNRDLLILEEELLYPASSQVAVYVSMDLGTYFALDAVKLEIDNQLIASELYTDKQTNALFRGGVQRLYVGNLKAGEHEISAFFTGRGPQKDYKRGAKLIVTKDQEPLVLELRIIDSTAQLQPVFDIKQWQM